MKEYIIHSDKYGDFKVLLDDEDYKYFIDNDITLSIHGAKRYKRPYVKFKRKCEDGIKRWTLLHRFITNCPNNKFVDHINRNPLDNRKENLRFCSNFENCQNKAEKNNGLPIGIGYHKASNKYRAYINRGNKQISLGYYANVDDAIKARQEYVTSKPW